jgi:phage baseplate assembly protein W
MTPISYDSGTDDEWDEDFEIETEPSLTYAMHITDEESRFLGRADDTDAIKQAVLKMIQTERYEYEIYSWDYGVELADLVGQPMPYVMSEVKRRITEALTVDDRIESVEDFEVQQSGKRTLQCSFTVVTEQGEEIDMEKEVEI